MSTTMNDQAADIALERVRAGEVSRPAADIAPTRHVAPSGLAGLAPWLLGGSSMRRGNELALSVIQEELRVIRTDHREARGP
jgi:hypothetical protein